MLNPNLDALRPSKWVKSMSRPRHDAIGCLSFQVYRNGVLDHVMKGPESLARNRIVMLNKLFPQERWSWAPSRHWHDTP